MVSLQNRMVNFRFQPSAVGGDWIRRTHAEWRCRDQQQRAADQHARAERHLALLMTAVAGMAVVVVALADWARW